MEAEAQKLVDATAKAFVTGRGMPGAMGAVSILFSNHKCRSIENFIFRCWAHLCFQEV